MNSRVSWSVDGIDPSVRERAEAAARRAGMSLNDWLNSSLNTAGAPAMTPAARDAHDVSDIHQRLDSITRQIERLAPSSQPRNDGVARQLNDAISRLDARLNRVAEPGPAQAAYQPSPSISPISLDDAIAQIAARQSQLDGRTPAPARPAPAMMPVMPAAAPAMAPVMPPMMAPVMAPPIAPPMPDFSGLERQLFNITNQIDALRRPDHGVEESLAAFRAELADIRKTITEAMPRQAIESLEGEIRTLARRIEDGRQSGVDGQALAGIERALGEIYEALRTLTPAEQLAGFDEAIRTLGGKIDTIAHASGDPRALQQLEGMIDALRGVVTNVASNDALVQLAEDVRGLSGNVDQLARQHDYSGSLNALEQRIAMLTNALENREPIAAGSAPDSSHLENAMRSLSDRIEHLQIGGGGDSSHIESAVRSLSDRIDHLQVGGGDGSAVIHHLEQRIAHLMERMEGAGSQNNNLARVEDALADILRHLADQRDNLAHQPAMSAPAMDGGLVDAIKRELTDMRFSQTETDRRTQDSLETVHSALGHVADRLSSIEGDLRKVQSAPIQSEAPRMAMPAAAPMPRPELPNPAMMQAPVAPQRSPMADVIIETAPAPQAPPPAVRPDAVTPRMPIDASLPPDHPLEPGSRTGGRVASPSERIAASEDALSDIPGAQAESGNASTFIAAARRAAQVAAQTAPAGGAKTGRITVLSNAAKPSNPQPVATDGTTKASKIRSLLVGVSVVVIVLSGFRLVMGMFDGGDPQANVPTEKSSELAPPPARLTPDAQPRSEAPAGPSMISPNPINRQSMLTPAPDFNRAPSPGPQIITVPPAARPAAAPAPAPALPPVAQIAAADPAEVTGSLPPKAGKTAAPVAAAPAAPVWTDTTASLTPMSEKLPDAIGSDRLRAAALKGDPAAAYEIGLRFAEGKGVAVNLDEAAKWYERAAIGGVTPAMFRLGTFYEKGLSVKKNPDTARRYYIQAAERGNAKAMHNLAVLDADGGGQGPNYKSAVQWFRKAADHGVADSQFNLGILYARGIGVDQNLAESYKWFSLAAAQGDADSGRKRDDVAKRLDAQSLAAAKLAIQTFTPEAQPEGAVNAAAPAGGWDGAAPAAKAAKTAAPKASSSKRAER